MATLVAQGRNRQRRVTECLDLYHAATTDQLAALIWGGNLRVAQAHLLRMVQEGRLTRSPHPVHRHGSYVYRLHGRSLSQKVLHQLSAVDFYLALVRDLARHGARSIPELSWSESVIPDQTVWYRGMTWAVEHHLTGRFDHARDYARFLERGEYLRCHWWRRDVEPESQTIGVLVVTEPLHIEHVRERLRRYLPPLRREPGEPVTLWRVGTRESVLANPASYLRPP